MPVLTAGSPLREGGIVLERSLARALGIEVGATLAVTSSRRLDRPSGARDGGRTQPAALPAPQPRPGLGHPRHARTRRARSHPLALDGGASTGESVRGCGVHRAGGSSACRLAPDLSFETWQVQRDYALGDAQPTQVIVTMFTILLLIVAFVVVGILVGARASDQHREIGLLKAAGFTPRQVGAVFALESAALGLVAAALGFALGSILAPRLAAPSAETLLGSPTIAANPWHILVASCVVLPVLLAGALTSTRRSTRFSVLEAIRAGSSSPPNSRLARAVARSVLPLTIGLGLKDLLARGRRALLLAAAIALTGAVVVVALSLDATLDAQAATGEASDIPDELPLLIYTLDTVLLLITVTTLVAVALLSVRERIRDYGVLKAIGLTPGRSPPPSSAPTPPSRWSPRSLPSRSASGSTSPSPGSPAARPRTPSSHPGGRSP